MLFRSTFAIIIVSFFFVVAAASFVEAENNDVPNKKLRSPRGSSNRERGSSNSDIPSASSFRRALAKKTTVKNTKYGGETCQFEAECVTNNCVAKKGGDSECELGEEHDECKEDSNCSTGLNCNTNLAPARCDNRTPGSFMANCDDDNDCQADNQFCDKWAGSFGTCRRPSGGYCEYDYYCVGACVNNRCE